MIVPIIIIGSIICLLIVLLTLLVSYYVVYLILEQQEHKDIEELEEEFLVLYTQEWIRKHKLPQIKFEDGDFSKNLHVFGKVPIEKATKIVIFHHGIRCNHKVVYKYLRFYMPKNIVVIAYDVRGWGEYRKISKLSYGYKEKQDLKRVVSFVRKLYPHKPIGIHGESMGGGTCYQFLTSYHKENLVDFAIIESGFVSFSKVLKYQAKTHYPFLPFVILLPIIKLFWWHRLKFKINELDVAEKLQYVKTPVLAISSKSDCLVPFSQHQIIRRSLSNIKIFETKDSPHVLTISMHFKDYERSIHDFLLHKAKRIKPH